MTYVCAKCSCLVIPLEFFAECEGISNILEKLLQRQNCYFCALPVWIFFHSKFSYPTFGSFDDKGKKLFSIHLFSSRFAVDNQDMIKRNVHVIDKPPSLSGQHLDYLYNFEWMVPISVPL